MSVYYNKKLISGVREVPQKTLAEYNALTNKPDLWLRTDAPESDRGISASDVEYSTGVSVEDKIDGLATLATQTITDTTTASGAILVPSAIQGKVVSCRYVGRTGLVFDRGDSYLTCKDNDLNPVSNTSVTVKIYYTTI